MTTHTRTAGPRGEAPVSGWLVFAAVIMIFSGVMAILGGISAIAKDDVFLATRNYVYELDLTGWGWVHLILGVVIALTGAALFTGATWARVVGVGLAGLSMIANFMWLPYTPWWALLLIAIDALIIWGLCVAPRPLRD
ncbi:hypothetical protein [Streptomyces sp. CC208A]|uniref:DUF7144 family membrane protein n=1 Tax=Streptomyces sp. CC208A TaxID=3044573 RepID=UPI0024A96906|nr:hypothetical protein [Streptomyces sp. CC208A]